MSAIGLHRLGLIVAAFVLQTALLRAALAGPDEAQARPSLVGQLLVAAPGVGDPRFERTVILIVEQGPDGTLGIVINKPIGEQPLASVFKALGQKDGDATGSCQCRSDFPQKCRSKIPQFGGHGDQPFARSAPPFFGGRPRRRRVGGIDAGWMLDFDRMCSGTRSACSRSR